MTKRTLLVILAVLALGASPIFAGSILAINLFSTGTTAAGAAAAGGSTDLHYVLDTSPNPAVVSSAQPFNWTPPYNWVANSSTSQWISFNANAIAITTTIDSPSIYQTTFTLPGGFNLGMLSIAGTWAADNCGSIYLNSVANTAISTLACTGAPTANYNAMNAFTINNSSSGITAGLNTLIFSTINVHSKVGDPNPAGLRVDFAGTYSSEIPEPGTLALLGGGLLALGLFRRRR